jgi:hypothetical protein
MPEIFNDTFHLDEAKFNSAGINRAASNKTTNKITYGRLYEKITNKYGNTLLKPIAENTVVLGGAINALEKLCGVEARFKPATLNEQKGLIVNGATGNDTICLFGAGTGGSGMDFSSVVDPDIKQRDILEMVPMRYAANITDEDNYGFKIEDTNNKGVYFWYLKKFDSEPTITSYWKNSVDTSADGTEIVSEVWNSSSTEGIETLAEFNFSLNTSDIREWYENAGQLSLARYNTFGFYTAEYVESAKEYANVRLFSCITFHNKDVTTETESSFVYRIYSLI